MKYLVICFLFFSISVGAQYIYWNQLEDLKPNEIEASTNGNIYAISGLNSMIYKSSNDGDSWSQIFQGGNWKSLKTKGDTIIAGTSDGKLYISTNGGETFYLSKTFPSTINCTEIADINEVNFVIAGTSANGIFISTDFGNSWSAYEFNGKSVRSLKIINDKIFVGTFNGGLFCSSDLGISWVRKIISFATENVLSIEQGESDSVIYVSNPKVYKSVDSGESWFLIHDVITYCIRYSTTEKQIFAGLEMSADSGATWRKVFSNGVEWLTIKDSLTYIIDTDYKLYREDLHPNPYIGNNYFPLSIGNIWQYVIYYYSTNGGPSTTKSYKLDYSEIIYDTLINNITYYRINGWGFNNFFRYHDNRLYRYNSNGDDIYMDFNLISGETFNFFGDQASIYESYEFVFGMNRLKKIALYHNPITSTTKYEYIDSLGRFNFDYVYPGSGGSYSHSQRFLLQAKIKFGDSIYQFKDNYPSPIINIETSFLPQDSIFTLGFIASHIWDKLGSTPENSLFFIDSVEVEYFFCGENDTTAIYRKQFFHHPNTNLFTDNIVFPDSFYHNNYTLHYKFHVKDKGLIPVYSSYPENSYLQFYIDPTGFKNVNKPELSFSLSQNYPNPFNPITNIQYAISNTQHVQLKVYDVLGNEVAVLVNEEKSPGNYSVEFNSKNLASGLYFYSLTAGSFKQAKKMLLIK